MRKSYVIFGSDDLSLEEGVRSFFKRLGLQSVGGILFVERNKNGLSLSISAPRFNRSYSLPIRSSRVRRGGKDTDVVFFVDLEDVVSEMKNFGLLKEYSFGGDTMEAFSTIDAASFASDGAPPSVSLLRHAKISSDERVGLEFGEEDVDFLSESDLLDFIPDEPSGDEFFVFFDEEDDLELGEDEVDLLDAMDDIAPYIEEDIREYIGIPEVTVRVHGNEVDIQFPDRRFTLQLVVDGSTLSVAGLGSLLRKAPPVLAETEFAKRDVPMWEIIEKDGIYVLRRKGRKERNEPEANHVDY